MVFAAVSVFCLKVLQKVISNCASSGHLRWDTHTLLLWVISRAKKFRPDLRNKERKLYENLETFLDKDFKGKSS